MPIRVLLGSVAGLLFLPLAAGAAGAGAGLDLPPWTAAPFALLLLAIAVLPVTVGHWWHANRNKALVAAGLAAPVAAYLLLVGPRTGGESVERLLHELGEYASFIILLTALYTISGGIVLRGNIPAHPLTNTAFLGFGAVLANFIGTTGASMVLIRPVLRINAVREHKSHVPVFFIFTVSNLGGLLTPLGDPPLFLGFLKGVGFFWTLSLWREWLLVNAVVLGIFYLWDAVAYHRESPEAIRRDETKHEPLCVEGLWPGVPLLAGVLLAVLFQSEQVGRAAGAPFDADLTVSKPWGVALMAFLTLLSLGLGSRRLRDANRFEWGPMAEVAILFAGIFVTMVPALALLEAHGGELGVSKPWQFFWLTGILSSFLDNAPTYVTFGTLAAGGHDFGWLAANAPKLLAAISCGAVFMGANTYIGNGPNFMVKAIAESNGYRMPSFGAYMVHSALVLLPVFAGVTIVFFC